MAKAEIKMVGFKSFSDHIEVLVKYKCKAGYKVSTDDGIKIYYSTTGKIESNTPFVKADIGNIFWVAANVKLANGWWTFSLRIPEESTTPLDDNTTYYLQAKFPVLKSNGDSYKTYKNPKNPTSIRTRLYAENQSLFLIEKYSDPYIDDGETHYITEWVDFTKNITFGSYNINYEDVEEDWEDADYVTHRIVPRSKVTGSLNLLFTDRYDYNNFIRLIRQNRVVNGNGYVRLRLQINDDLDDFEEFVDYTEDQLRRKKALIYDGSFFLKFEENPWAVPMFGHYDQYEPIRVEITEA